MKFKRTKKLNPKGIIVIISLLTIILTHLIPFMMGGLDDKYVTLHVWLNIISALLIFWNVKR